MEDCGLVSIITPTWSCAAFICDTIRSVQAQTYQNWEMIISDDCSTDNTKKVIEPYLQADNRIKYICNEKNSGAAITRNNALKVAKGKWIAFLDADDLWHPEKLKKQVEFMVENGYHFSYTEYVEMDETGKEMGVLISGPKHVNRRGMYNFCWPGCLTVMYDRELVGLIQIADIKKNNDYAMWLKVCHKADCHLLAEPLAKYRRGRSGSISTHGYVALIKWHYKLFRDAEKMNPIFASFLTCLNMVCGVYKKIKYVRNSVRE